MDRLIDTINLGLAIRHTSQTGTGQQSQRTRNNTGLVRNDVAKEIARDDDTIQLARVLDHEHSRRVNQMVTQLQLRELLGHDLRNNLAPKSAGREHIGLVQTPHWQGRVTLQREVAGKTRDALNLGARVRFRVESEAVAFVFLAIPKVDSARQFADDVEVDATAHVGLERGDVDERRGCKVAWSEVAKCAQFFTQFE